MRVLVSQKEASNELQIQEIPDIKQQGENATRPIRVALVTKNPALPPTFQHRYFQLQISIFCKIDSPNFDFIFQTCNFQTSENSITNLLTNKRRQSIS